MPHSRWLGRWKIGSVLAVLTVFIACGMVRYWDAQGDDLASSYIGCRLMTTGQTSHLYSYDPDDFAAVGDDPAWQDAADEGGFKSWLHPYVQTPLWAYTLQPICRGSFASFEHLFVVGSLLCFAGCLWLVAWYWAPVFLSPWAMGFVVLGLWLSQPFQYAMWLVQTHILFLLLTMAALILAERQKPGWAGLLLACAAAVKVTPGILVVYWFLTRRWKAAGSAVLWSGILAIAAVMATGSHLMTVYLADLQRISRLLLVAFNNQSFAAWWMGRFYPGEVYEFHMLPMPDAMRIGSLALMVAFTALGGWIDRGRKDEQAPSGSMVALVAGTVFAPIAWTHYSIVLMPALMVLWQEFRRLRRQWIAVAVVTIAALNFWPLATVAINGGHGRLTVLRSEFYAEELCMAAFVCIAWTMRRDAPNASLACATASWSAVPPHTASS